jgi:hypothetical protein
MRVLIHERMTSNKYFGTILIYLGVGGWWWVIECWWVTKHNVRAEVISVQQCSRIIVRIMYVYLQPPKQLSGCHHHHYH